MRSAVSDLHAIQGWTFVLEPESVYFQIEQLRQLSGLAVCGLVRKNEARLVDIFGDILNQLRSQNRDIVGRLDLDTVCAVR